MVQVPCAAAAAVPGSNDKVPRCLLLLLSSLHHPRRRQSQSRRQTRSASSSLSLVCCGEPLVAFFVPTGVVLKVLLSRQTLPKNTPLLISVGFIAFISTRDIIERRASSSTSIGHIWADSYSASLRPCVGLEDLSFVARLRSFVIGG